MSRRDVTSSRRTFLRSTAGMATAALASSAAGSAAAQSGGPDYGGWFDGVSNFDGTVDKTGQDTVEITVGAEANGGNFGFGPAAVRVSPGTKVVWTWNGKGGAHNVVATDGTFDSGSPVADSGKTFSYTFEKKGVYKYYCTPHKTLGMKGAIVVGGSGGSGGGTVPEPSYGGWFDNVSNYEKTVDKRGQDTVEITVGTRANGGNFGFGPAAVRVSPGTKVVWTWNGKGGAHNVVASDGSFKSGSPVSKQGTTFSHTFESEGVYRYYCTPHKTLGMKGAVVVGAPQSGGGGGGGAGGEASGRVAWTPGLVMFAGAVVMGMVSPILFSAFLRVKHGQWERPREFEREEETPGREVPVAEEAPEEDHERELTHDEYDPSGTLSLIVIYFAILVLMWVFIYFVEFLGRGPTVIG